MRDLVLPTWLMGLWDRLLTSFWFLPSSMAFGAIILSFGLLELDSNLGSEGVRRLGWMYAFGPEGARAVLSAIAGSMITVAGLTFSITMLTLQLAASQFGPRLLRSLMRDRGNQIVLGTFTSTFLFCLLVLRAVRGTEEASFVPHLSVAFGVILATLSIAVLIYFIHHVATSVRIETVLANLSTETLAAIDRLYPEQVGQEADARDLQVASARDVLESDALSVCVEASGYVQRVDDEALMRIATEQDLLIRIDARPGVFVTAREPILRVAPRARASHKVAAALRGAFVIGTDRTPTQDLEFSLRRLVEIAQRSLSPGINDPTTALYCIDRLSEALCRLADRPIPAPARADEHGELRVLTTVSTLDDLALPAIAAIARYGVGDADVVRRIQQMIEVVSRHAAPNVRDALLRLGDSIQEASRSKFAAFEGDVPDIVRPNVGRGR